MEDPNTTISGSSTKTDYRLMQVKSVAECSKGTNTFDLH